MSRGASGARRFVLAASVCLLALAAGALALPKRVAFQGKLLDPATNLPKNGAFSMTFRLYNAPSGGTALWTETQPSVSVSNGVFAVQLGTVTALTETLFQGASAFLSVQVGGDSEMSPRHQLVQAAYAFTAMELADSGDITVAAGPNVSTFTSTGNLLVPYGIVVTSITASTLTLTGAGNDQYSLRTASGIYVASGTLNINASGGAIARYGLVAATGSFTATGPAQYSLETSSGVRVITGSLAVNGGGGVRVLYGVVAATGAYSGVLAAYGSVHATSGTFTSNGADQYSLRTASGIYVASGTLHVAGGGGLRAVFGVNAASGTFGSVGLSTPAAVTSITADNTLITVGNQGFIRLTSNNATSTNRTFCLTAGRPGQMLIMMVDNTAGTNEVELIDGLGAAGNCTLANGAVNALLNAVWPATTNQPGDSVILIFDGNNWVELSRQAN